MGGLIALVVAVVLGSALSSKSSSSKSKGNDSDNGKIKPKTATIVIDFDEPEPQDPKRGGYCHVEGQAPGEHWTYDSNGNCVKFWDKELEDVFAALYDQYLEENGISQDDACATGQVHEEANGDITVELNPTQLKAVRTVVGQMYDGMIDPSKFPPGETDLFFDRTVYARATFVFLSRVCGLTGN